MKNFHGHFSPTVPTPGFVTLYSDNKAFAFFTGFVGWYFLTLVMALITGMFWFVLHLPAGETRVEEWALPLQVLVGALFVLLLLIGLATLLVRLLYPLFTGAGIALLLMIGKNQKRDSFAMWWCGLGVWAAYITNIVGSYIVDREGTWLTYIWSSIPFFLDSSPSSPYHLVNLFFILGQ